MSDRFETFERALTKGIETVFAERRLPVKKTVRPPSSLHTDVVVATIGFACPQARGGLTALATPRALRALSDTPAPDADPLRELLNMLLGRMKAELFAHGFVLLLGMPSSMIVRDAHFPPGSEPAHSCWHSVEPFPGERIFLRLDASFEDTEPIPASRRPEPIGDAGTFFLF